jgi:hypothetical protein
VEAEVLHTAEAERSNNNSSSLKEVLADTASLLSSSKVATDSSLSRVKDSTELPVFQLAGELPPFLTPRPSHVLDR